MNPTCDQARPMLSAVIDGDLDRLDADAVRAHVTGCAGCAGVMADLGKLRQTARELGPVIPPEQSWQVIARRTRGETEKAPATRPLRQSVAPVWQWVGLSAGLLAVTTVLYFVGPRQPVTDSTARAVTPTIAAPATPAPALTDDLNAAVGHYERAIAVLQAAASKGTTGIEPDAVAALAADGTALDRAIAESRVALAESPENESARISLFEALRRKIAMLQATVTLINEMNQGDPAGAARAADGLGREL